MKIFEKIQAKIRRTRNELTIFHSVIKGFATLCLAGMLYGFVEPFSSNMFILNRLSDDVLFGILFLLLFIFTDGTPNEKNKDTLSTIDFKAQSNNHRLLPYTMSHNINFELIKYIEFYQKEGNHTDKTIGFLLGLQESVKIADHYENQE